MSGYYGARFADAWNGVDPAVMRRCWTEELAGYSAEEIAAGLCAMKSRDWPPTLPEFLKLCRPALDHERAFIEAIEQMRKRETGGDTWSTPAVFWAAVKLGCDLRAHPYAAIKGRWAAALDEATENIRTGKLPNEIPPRRDALPAPGQCSVSPEAAKQRLDAIRANLAAKMALQ
jgi:hypothetical protein